MAPNDIEKAKVRKAKGCAALVALALATGVGLCAAPRNSVVSIILRLEDEQGRDFIGPASATFYDAQGQELAKIPREQTFAWVHWWASTRYPEKSTLTVEDALRVRRATVVASGCEPVDLSLSVPRRYMGPSCLPHGGGPAYYLHEVDQVVRISCPAGN